MSDFTSKIKTKRALISWLLCFGAIFYLTLTKGTPNVNISIPHIDKVAHFVMFFSLAVLGSILIIKKVILKDNLKSHFLNFVFTSLLGVLIEIIQPFFGRTKSIDDFYFDVLGAFFGVLFSRFIYFRIIKSILK